MSSKLVIVFGDRAFKKMTKFNGDGQVGLKEERCTRKVRTQRKAM